MCALCPSNGPERKEVQNNIVAVNALWQPPGRMEGGTMATHNSLCPCSAGLLKECAMLDIGLKGWTHLLISLRDSRNLTVEDFDTMLAQHLFPCKVVVPCDGFKYEVFASHTKYFVPMLYRFIRVPIDVGMDRAAHCTVCPALLHFPLQTAVSLVRCLVYCCYPVLVQQFKVTRTTAQVEMNWCECT